MTKKKGFFGNILEGPNDVGSILLRLIQREEMPSEVNTCKYTYNKYTFNLHRKTTI